MVSLAPSLVGVILLLFHFFFANYSSSCKCCVSSYFRVSFKSTKLSYICLNCYMAAKEKRWKYFFFDMSKEDARCWWLFAVGWERGEFVRDKKGGLKRTGAAGGRRGERKIERKKKIWKKKMLANRRCWWTLKREDPTTLQSSFCLPPLLHRGRFFL